MPIAPNFTSVLSKDWEINFTQCAPNGYLKYTDLCNLLQLTAAAHSEIGGISFADMQEFNQAWVLSRMRVEITALPKCNDIVTVKTWINTLGKFPFGSGFGNACQRKENCRFRNFLGCI